MSTKLIEMNGYLYLSKSGGYPTYMFKDLNDLYCYIAKTDETNNGDTKNDYSRWLKKSACDDLMAHLDALKELNKKTKEEEHMNVYKQPTTVIDIDEHEWGYSISKGKVILNKEFKYRDDADEMIKSIQDSEYIFITDWLMRGSYRRMKCTNYGVNYALDANEVLLTLVYAD